MTRFALLSACLFCSLLGSTTLACSAPADRDGESALSAEGALATRTNLAKQVQDEIDENGVDHLTVVGRAGLKNGSTVLREAQKAFDEVKQEYRNDGTTEAYRFGSGAKAAFIVMADGGDDAGYDVRVFDANDTLIMRGSAPSSAESIDWTVIGTPVSDRAAASRKALADDVKVVLDRDGTNGMTETDRRGLYTWGSPMAHARKGFDDLKAEFGAVSVHRTQIKGDTWVFILEGSNDDGARVLVYSEFDICVLEGNAPSSSEAYDWEYRGLTNE
jgi:hypothetical protein